MKYFFTFLLAVPSLNLCAQTSSVAATSVSPLAVYSDAWNNAKYSVCNTAASVTYMTEAEKEVIYILNLVHFDPALFANTVLKKYPALSGNNYLTNDVFYYKSLIKTLLKLKPLTLFYPDETCYKSAQCHAYSSGQNGYAGHERQTQACKKIKDYYGECCDYGHSDPLEIVLSLLIDEGVPSLGHRALLLNSYTKIGVSIQPHIKYNFTAVIDFYY